MGDVSATLFCAGVGGGGGESFTALEGHQALPDFPFDRCRVEMKMLEWIESVA